MDRDRDDAPTEGAGAGEMPSFNQLLGVLLEAVSEASRPGGAGGLADPGRSPEDARDRFLERSMVSIGWPTGEGVAGLTREELWRVVYDRLPSLSSTERSRAINSLYRFANTVTRDDLVLTPDSRRAILLGRIEGPYSYTDEALVANHHHHREVRWFADRRQQQGSIVD